MQSAVEPGADEIVVVKFGVGRADTIDLLHLAGRKVFVRVQAPAAGE